MEVGAVADWLVAFATLLALLLAVWELRLNARRAGEAYAREAWMKYLELGLANPDLGETRVAKEQFKMNIKALMSGDTLESQRYLWFLDIMLEASENLLEYFPSSAWKNTIRFNLELHKEALSTGVPEREAFYSAELSSLIREVVSHNA